MYKVGKKRFFKRRNLFLVSFLAIAGIFSAGAIITNKQNNENPIVEKADAASTMVSGSRVFIQDESGKGWTKDGIDAIMHIYNPNFASGSGYSSFADVKLNDLYATSFATDGSTYMNVRMKWSDSGSGQRYEAILPWYITSFTTEFYATENSVDRYVFYKNSDGSKGSKMSVTLSRGDNVSIYMFNTSDWRGQCYWSGSDFVAITDIPARGTGYTYEFNGIKSGSHMYISTEDLTEWEGSGAKIGINFQKSNIHIGPGWSSKYNSAHTSLSTAFCWKVKGSGNDHLYECIVPQYNGQDVYWSMVIGVRYNSSATSLSWSDVWNQTGDQFYNGDDRDCNMLWVNAASGGSWSGGGYLRNDASISDDTRAGYYGTYFLSQITCDGDGSITSTSSNWTNVKNEYKQYMSTAVEGKVWTSTGSAGGTDLQKAVYRYDYIVFHKGYSGYDDFINRATSSGKQFAINSFSPFGLISDKDNISTIIIIIASSISLLSITALSVLVIKKRKRKEQ